MPDTDFYSEERLMTNGTSLRLPLGCLALLIFCLAKPTAVPAPSPPRAGLAGSASCRECHPKFYQLWSTSFHGLALQPATPELLKSLPTHANAISSGKYKFRADVARGVIAESGPGGSQEYPISHLVGGKNVYYFLTPLERGRLQVLPLAYDVRRREWLDTTASAVRHFQDGNDEALYWKERQLTFNTSCHSCHVSQLQKNYDPRDDSYHTTWAEPGISCETCHGPSAGHAQIFCRLPKDVQPPEDVGLIVTRTLTTTQRNDSCAPCHAKMSPITPSFTPGDRYFDHFDLVALEHPDFYPDGRDLGENYTITGWRMSPCAASGKLDCLHCHTSSGRYRFTDVSRANDACLPCHKERVENAPAHTHHEAGCEGNRCVSCHMPTSEFARMRRSDHSMLPPTPATTLAYNSPNACGTCHTNGASWADQQVRTWHKGDYQNPVLERAGLIDAARKNDWRRLPEILAYLQHTNRTEIQSASLIRLLEDCPDHSKYPVLRGLLGSPEGAGAAAPGHSGDPSPLVRSSAAEGLGFRLDPGNVAALSRATDDESRLVRVRAAAALAPVPDQMLPAEKRGSVEAAMNEHIAALKARLDDPNSHYNLGNFLFARGQPKAAIDSFAFASKLEPRMVPPYVNASLVYNALGDNLNAEASLRKALALESTNAAVHLNLAMLMAELGKPAVAEEHFRSAFKNDPRSAQAAYNLSVLVSENDPNEAIEWSGKAANLNPNEPKYAYTHAFFLARAGRASQAVEVLRAALVRHPDDGQMRTLLRQLQR